MEIALVTLSAVLGLLIGSFLNVVAYRLPRGESVVTPRSRCPGCATEIAPRDNLPVVSWLVLGGRCRHCRAPISPRYPITELATGVLFAALAWRFGFTAELPAFLVLAAALVAVTSTDLEHRLVPKRIVWPAFLCGATVLVVAAFTQQDLGRLIWAAVGAAAAFGVLFLIHLVSPRGMGFGDVRLAALLGLFLGWLGLGHVGLGLFAAFVGGGVGGVLALAAGRSRRSALPFAPFLAAGTLFAVFWGRPVLEWYLGSFG